jgi:hypothetical protein
MVFFYLQNPLLSAQGSQGFAWCNASGFGQCSPPELAVDVGVTALCAGYGHTCILDTLPTRFLACSWILLIMPSNAFKAGMTELLNYCSHCRQVSTVCFVGSGRSTATCFCGRCDFRGRLHCFGDNVYGQCAVPIELASTKVVSIAAGFRHSCAVTAQGVLLCFGDNSSSVKKRFLQASKLKERMDIW